MPYSMKELARFQRMTAAKPNFDRNGRVTNGLGYWFGLIFGLGGKSAQGAILRWGLLLVLTSVFGLKKKLLGQ